MSIDSPVPRQDITALEQGGDQLVFMGGIGYDDERNREVGRVVMTLTGHSSLIDTPGFPHSMEGEDGPVVFVDPTGTEEELTSKEAMGRLDEEVQARFTKLHEQRAISLIEQIEAAGGKPVDAIFQSVDVSTGILAMHKRPDLFRHVALLDPSSIIKLPPRSTYLREEWGNLKNIVKNSRQPKEEPRFEQPPSLKEARDRSKRSAAHGNKHATYISYQAQMLHEVAQLEDGPSISIVASRYDHAYTPERLIQSLVDLDDITYMYITDFRHGLGGKQKKLEQLVAAFAEKPGADGTFLDRLGFAESIAPAYRHRITELIREREAQDSIK